MQGVFALYVLREAFLAVRGDARLVLGLRSPTGAWAPGLHSCVPAGCATRHARSCLQPRFHLAVHSRRLGAEATGPLHHIACADTSFFAAFQCDLTGEHTFEDRPLPTEDFSREHAIIAADIVL